MSQPISQTPTIPYPQSIPTRTEQITDFYSFSPLVVGKGGNGTVMRSTSLLTGSPVAIKVRPRTEFAKREAEMLKTVRAAHAVRYREIFEDPVDCDSPKLYFVMDLIPEKDITAAFLFQDPNKCLSLSEVVCISTQALKFLTDLQRQKANFFDLKPTNLIFHRPSRSLTVVDFESVRQIRSKNPITTIATVSFRAPEYILHSHIDSSYDCWSLACTIFELMTSTILFPVPSGVSIEDQDNYLLQLIVQQIGLPSAEYLKSCDKAAEYFDENMQFRRILNVSAYQYLHWKVRIREVAQIKKWPLDEVEQFIDILSQLLCYENRINAYALSKHPFFNREIIVNLLREPQKKTGRMVIQRASTLPGPAKDLKLEDIAFPDLTIDFSQSIPRSLCLPKDPEEKYLVLLENQGTLIKSECVFRNKNTLDIRKLQKDSAGRLNRLNSLRSRPRQASIPQHSQGAKRSLNFSPDEAAEGPELKKLKK